MNNCYFSQGFFLNLLRRESELMIIKESQVINTKSGNISNLRDGKRKVGINMK